MEKSEIFLEEVDSISPQLDTSQAFLLGVLHARTELSLSLLSKFLVSFHTSIQARQLEGRDIAKLESLLLEGKIGLAKKTLEEFPKKPAKCEVCQGEVSEEERIEISCAHHLHTECLRLDLNSRLSKGITGLFLPCECESEIEPNFLEGFDRELYLEFLDLKLHTLIAEGEFGELISCPICREKYSVEGDLNVECVKCLKRICIACNRLAEVCGCEDPKLSSE